MASLHQVLGALATAVSTVTSGLPAKSGGTLSVQVGIDWPPIKVLQSAVGTNNVIVAVFDRRLTRNTTRWKPTVIGQSQTVATLTTTVATTGTGFTITLGGTITAGDAVSCVVTNRGKIETGTPQIGVVVSGAGTDTPTTMATALATAINANAGLAAWVSATAAGPVVTLTSLVSGLGIMSATGNNGTETIEIGRRQRQLQVVIWASTIEDRDTVVNVIDVLLANYEVQLYPYQSGLVLPDGTSGYLTVGTDFNLDDATLSDAYRHDFLCAVEHAVTTQDALYSVLAPITQWSF